MLLQDQCWSNCRESRQLTQMISANNIAMFFTRILLQKHSSIVGRFARLYKLIGFNPQNEIYGPPIKNASPGHRFYSAARSGKVH
jgi:hypothetical protein